MDDLGIPLFLETPIDHPSMVCLLPFGGFFMVNVGKFKIYHPWMVCDRLVKILTNLPRQKGVNKSGLVFGVLFVTGVGGDLDETLVNRGCLCFVYFV